MIENTFKYVITQEELANLFPTGTPTKSEIFHKNETYKPTRAKKGIAPDFVREFLKKKGVDYSFRVVAHINLRGGIGKTTSSITGATRAAQYGFRTCILDLDMQASASLAFDLCLEEDDPIFYDVWQKPSEMLIPSLHKIQDNLYILPSSLENGLLDSSLSNPNSQKNAVLGICQELKKNDFDLVMIDCPPSLSAVVVSSICAADTIVIPLGSDIFSFKGLELTLEEINSICNTFNIKKPDVKILFSRLDRREKLSLQAIERLKSGYGEYFIPFFIRTTTEFSKALERKETVFASSRKSSAKDDYDIYIRSLLSLNPDDLHSAAWPQPK